MKVIDEVKAYKLYLNNDGMLEALLGPDGNHLELRVAAEFVSGDPLCLSGYLYCVLPVVVAGMDGVSIGLICQPAFEEPDEDEDEEDEDDEDDFFAD
jgi:hypothetical protein